MADKNMTRGSQEPVYFLYERWLRIRQFAVCSGFKEPNYCEYGESTICNGGVLLFFKGSKEFLNWSSYLKLSSETKSNNFNFNKTSNKNNSKKVQTNRSTALGENPFWKHIIKYKFLYKIFSINQRGYTIH